MTGKSSIVWLSLADNLSDAILLPRRGVHTLALSSAAPFVFATWG